MDTATDATIPMRALLAGARRKERTLLDLVRKLVETESPSDVKAAVDECVALLLRTPGGWVAGSNCIDSAGLATCWKRGSARARKAPMLTGFFCLGIWTPCGP